MDIRKAQNNKSDCDLVFSLSNDTLVRSFSFNTEPILYENHVNWYKRTIADTNVLFYLIFENKNFVGQIRFNRKSAKSKNCVISLSITENFRGQGIGSSFLNLGIKAMKKDWPCINEVDAEVKDSNLPSNKLFSKAGFNLKEKVNQYTYNISLN